MAPSELKRKRHDDGRNARKSKKVKEAAATKPKPAAVPQPEKTIPRFEEGQADVLRALKKAKGFERQRLSKRINEEKKIIKARDKARKRASGEASSDPAEDGTSEKLQRLEREVDVLKHIDLSVAARVHLASVMLRIKDLAEAVGPLPVFLQRAAQVPESQEQQWAKEGVHNVTSSLYGKPMVREAVDKAVRGVCQKLCIEPPTDRKLKKGKNSSKSAPAGNNDDDDDDDNDDDDDDDSDLEVIDSISDYESSEDEEGSSNNKKQTRQEKREKKAKRQQQKEEEEEERQLAYYDAMLGERSEDDDSDKEDVAALRAKYQQALAVAEAEGPGEYKEEGDDEDEEEEEEFEGFSDEDEGSDDDSEEDDDDDDEDEDSDEDSDEESDEDLRPPPRKRKAEARDTAAEDSHGGGSSFMSALMMSGYAAGGGDRDSNDDEDYEEAAARMLAPQRKNRRGQRARQAIWEKKFKEQAKHVKNQEGKGKTKDGAWDLKRGAVAEGDGPRWLRRKQAKEQGRRHGKLGAGGGDEPARREKKESIKKRDDEGPLHPSWEAAKKAKEKAQTAPFQGKKITFD